MLGSRLIGVGIGAAQLPERADLGCSLLARLSWGFFGLGVLRHCGQPLAGLYERSINGAYDQGKVLSAVLHALGALREPLSKTLCLAVMVSEPHAAELELEVFKEGLALLSEEVHVRIEAP